MKDCLVGLLALALLLTAGCCDARGFIRGEKPLEPREPVELFVQGMEQWESVVFGGDGEIVFDDGVLTLDMGGPLTGVRYTGDLTAVLGEDLQPYELSLQARRVEGLDFFCCLTFPVGTEGYVSLVLGGWAGSTVGISSLDGFDAASNATTQLLRFEQERWYDIKVRVTQAKIECFLDGERIVDVVRADYEAFSLRPEVQDTAPLGISTFQTRGEIRNLTATRLD